MENSNSNSKSSWLRNFLKFNNTKFTYKYTNKYPYPHSYPYPYQLPLGKYPFDYRYDTFRRRNPYYYPKPPIGLYPFVFGNFED